MSLSEGLRAQVGLRNSALMDNFGFWNFREAVNGPLSGHEWTKGARGAVRPRVRPTSQNNSSAKFVHFYTLLLSSRTYEYSLVYLPRSGEGLYVLPVLIIQRPGAHGHGAISWVGSGYVITISHGRNLSRHVAPGPPGAHMPEASLA